MKPRIRIDSDLVWASLLCGLVIAGTALKVILYGGPF